MDRMYASALRVALLMQIEGHLKIPDCIYTSRFAAPTPIEAFYIQRMHRYLDVTANYLVITP